jgi:hypothetical protein
LGGFEAIFGVFEAIFGVFEAIFGVFEVFLVFLRCFFWGFEVSLIGNGQNLMGLKNTNFYTFYI